MRKLLKLVAIGALLAVGPIQAFALDPSDEVKIFIPDTITSTFTGTKDFFFFDVGGVDRLQTGTNPTTGEPVTIAVPHPLFDPIIQGAFILAEGTDVLVLSEGATGGPFSDVFSLNIARTVPQPTDETQHRYKLTFNFFDAPTDDAISGKCGETGVTCIFRPESDFGTLTSLHGLGFHTGLGQTDGFDVMLQSNVDVIPEPEIYAMMGIGLALMGFVARRRKGQAVA